MAQNEMYPIVGIGNIICPTAEKNGWNEWTNMT